MSRLRLGQLLPLLLPVALASHAGCSRTQNAGQALVGPSPLAERFQHVDVEITDVDQQSVGGGLPLTVPPSTSVEGEVEHLPETGSLWVVALDRTQGDRRIYGPAHVGPEGSWSCLVPLPQKMERDTDLELRAVAAGSPPFPDIEQKEDGRLLSEQEWGQTAARDDVRLSLPVKVEVPQRRRRYVMIARVTSGGEPAEEKPAGSASGDDARESSRLDTVGGAVSDGPANDTLVDGRGEGLLPQGSSRDEVVDAEGNVEGEVAGVPPGSIVHILLHEARSGRWWLPGCSTVVTEDGEWSVGGVPFAHPAMPRQFQYEVRALVTRRQLRTGAISRREWQKRALSVSLPTSVVVRPVRDAVDCAGSGQLTVEKFERAPVKDDAVRSATRRGRLCGRVIGIEPSLQIWVIARPIASSRWYVLPDTAQRTEEDRWEHLGVTLPVTDDGSPSEWEVRAVASPDLLPAGQVAPGHLQRYVYCSSAPTYVKIKQTQPENSQATANGTVASAPEDVAANDDSATPTWSDESSGLGGWLEEAAMFVEDHWLLLLLLLALAALMLAAVVVMVTRFAGTVVALCRPIVSLVDEMLGYPPAAEVLRAFGHSMIGIVLIGVQVFLMLAFYPAYAAMVRKVLGLDTSQSLAAAKLLMGAAAMAGVSIHFVLEVAHQLPPLAYDGRGQDDKAAAWVKKIWPVLLLMAGMLWGFQGVVIGVSASALAAEGSPFAVLGGALFGLFWAAVETINFWIGTRFLFPSVTVWPLYGIALMPRMLYRAAESREPDLLTIAAVDGQPATHPEVGVVGTTDVEGIVRRVPPGADVWLCVLGPRDPKILSALRCDVHGARWRGAIPWSGVHGTSGNAFRLQAVLSLTDPARGCTPVARSETVAVVAR